MDNQPDSLQFVGNTKIVFYAPHVFNEWRVRWIIVFLTTYNFGQVCLQYPGENKSKHWWVLS